MGASVTLDGDGNGASGTGGLRHRAHVAGSPEETAEVVDDFVADGVAAGDQLLLVVGPPTVARLRHGLGAHAGVAAVIPPDDFYTAPAWTMARLRHEVETRVAGGGTLRLVAEPAWWQRPANEREAWLSMEAVANAAFASAPLEVLCAYDGSAPPDVVEGVHHTHPQVVVDGEIRSSATYTDPALYCTRHRDRPLPPLPGPVDEHEFNGATLAALRRAVSGWAAAGGLGPLRTGEVALAVHEVATNSVRHAGGEGTLRLAATGDELLAEVRDSGTISAPFAGLLPPPRTGKSGYGLWLVHQLVELVEIRSGPTGSAVRLHVRRPVAPS